MAKSPEEMTEQMILNLPERTGKSLDEWLKITKASKLAKHGEIVSLLKTKHGVTHGYANIIALRTLQGGASAVSGGDLLSAQYSGAKASMKPIYDKLIAAINQLGRDVEVSPKKTYVSLRRNKQFALIQPSTATRLDIGINLKGTTPTKRLETSGSFNAMVSHRVRVENEKQIDAELVRWLKRAYEIA